MGLRRPLLALLIGILAAAALTACGGDDEGGEATVTESVTQPEPQTGVDDRDDGQQGAGDDQRGDDDRDDRGDDDRPARGGQAFRGCRNPNRTGKINMAGAGTLVLRRAGGRLSVSKVRPAQGWRSKVERGDDGDEIELDFRRGEEEIELEAELDDGRLEVEVCRED